MTPARFFEFVIDTIPGPIQDAIEATTAYAYTSNQDIAYVMGFAHAVRSNWSVETSHFKIYDHIMNACAIMLVSSGTQLERMLDEYAERIVELHDGH